jgi:hypothetical protein
MFSTTIPQRHVCYRLGLHFLQVLYTLRDPKQEEEEYQDRFQVLLARADPLNEEQRVQLFTGGLRPPLSFDVRDLNPQSLAAAMSLARQLELRNQYTAAPPRPAGRGLLPVPAPCLALSAPPAPKADTSTVTVEGRPVKRLT